MVPLKNSTFVMLPFASDADAVMVIVAGAVNEAPFNGEVMLVIGNELPTEIFTEDDVVVAPPLSVAFAVRTYDPAAALLHAKVYGELVSSPNFVEPWKNSTLVTVPFGSDEVALMLMVEPVLKLAPFVGEVIATTGGAFPTVMLTTEDVADEPSLSVALAVKA